MSKKISFVFIVLLGVALLLSGCVDKKQLDRIEENQKEILAKVRIIEAGQKEMAQKVAAPAAPQRPQVDYNKVHNLPIGTSAVKGNKNAPITITEFSDFQCPYCSRLQPTLSDVLKAYPEDVKLVFKDFPLSFHKQARNAAKAARAAGEQGKYWEMHDLIFADFNKLTDNSYKEYATKLGLDVNKFTADFSSNKYDALIQQDIALGRQAGVTGTPSLFLNGKRMQRRSLEDFKEAIDAELKKK